MINTCTSSLVRNNCFDICFVDIDRHFAYDILKSRDILLPWTSFYTYLQQNINVQMIYYYINGKLKQSYTLQFVTSEIIFIVNVVI